MNTPLRRAGWWLCLVWLNSHVLPAISQADDAAAGLQWQVRRSAVLGGSEERWHVLLPAETPADAVIVWTHSANQRTLAQGQADIQLNKAGMKLAEIKLALPRLAEGVELETTLTAVALVRDKPSGELKQRVWILPEDPFTARKEWLKQLQIALFDPVGDTHRMFSRERIPVERLGSVEDLARLQGRLLIVGEGVSLVRNRGLGEAVQQLAADGNRILWLTPSEGSLPFPVDAAAESLGLERLSMRRGDVVQELDKRLDLSVWSTPESAPRRLEVLSQRGRPAWEIGEQAGRWHWLDLEFTSRGRLIVSGYPLIANWQEGATPRYLLARILEVLEVKTAEPGLEQHSVRAGR